MEMRTLSDVEISEVLFRISEIHSGILDCVRRGDVDNSRHWARQIAHSGMLLLSQDNLQERMATLKRFSGV